MSWKVFEMIKSNVAPIPYVLTKRSITIHYQDNSYSAVVGDFLYERLVSAIRNERWDEIPSLLKPSLNDNY